MADATGTLVVAWRTTANAIARKVGAQQPVIDHLAGIAEAMEARIKTGGGLAYDPDSEQEAETPFLTVGSEDLLDSKLAAEMMKGGSLPSITANELKTRRIVGYGLVRDDGSDRTLYIKRYNPVSVGSKSLVTLFRGELARVDDPILAFDPTFDVIIRGGDVWALNQRHFEALFAHEDVVMESVPKWSDDVRKRVPMSDASYERLQKYARSNSVYRRKLQSIVRKNDVPILDQDELREALVASDLEPDDYLRNGKLSIRKSTVKGALGMLNEDLHEGFFSSKRWVSGRKAEF